MKGGYITHDVQGKIDRTAHAWAKMELGMYSFPDGKQKFAKNEDGIKIYRVVKEEAARYGWGHPIGRRTYKWLFSKDGKYNELLEHRIVVHRQRLSGGFSAELAKLTDDGDALTHLSKKLYETLMDDLCDPDRAAEISFRDRAFLYKEVTKLEAQVKGEAAGSGAQPVIKATNIIGTLTLPDSVRDRVQAQVEAIEGKLVEDAEE